MAAIRWPSKRIRRQRNPYFGQKQVVNVNTYLGGGRDFGPFPGPGPFPHIISRNLTPDKTGRPEGGNTFATFKAIMRTGIDTDNVHPTCTGAPTENVSSSIPWGSSPDHAVAGLSKHD